MKRILIILFLASAMANASSLALFPSSNIIDYSATADSFLVSSDTQWTISQDPSDTWVTHLSTADSSGNVTVVLTVTKNDQSQVQRVAVLTVNTDDLTVSRTYTLRQNGDITDPVVSVDSKRTNDNRPSLTGTVDDNTVTMSVVVNGVTYNNPATFNIAGASAPCTWTLADNTIQTLADGTYEVQVTATDPAGNSGTDATNSELAVDTTPPVFSSVVIKSNQSDTTIAKVGNIISVLFTSNESLSGTPSVSIHGKVAAVNRSGLNYTATYTLQSSDADADPLPFTIDAVDLAGNSITTITEDDIASSVKFDKTAPTLTDVSISSNNANPALAKSGNQISVVFTVNETLRSTPTVTINSQSATVSSSGVLTYTALYTMSSLTDLAAIPFTINYIDKAGNSGAQGTSTTDASSVRYDVTAPTLSNVSIVSGNAVPTLAKTGDLVTLTFTADETLLSSALPTVNILGTAVTPTKSGLDYTAEYTLLATDTQGLVSFTIDFFDAAGNAGLQVDENSASNSVTFDRTKPTLSNLKIQSNNADSTQAVVGNQISVTFLVSEQLGADPTVTISGRAATISKSGLTYTAVYTMQAIDTEIAQIPFTVDFTDRSGNAGVQVTQTSTSDGSSVKFDKTAPTLSSISITSSNAVATRAKIGDTITLSFTASETLHSTMTVLILGNAATVTHSGLDYTATYVTQNTDASVNPVPFSIAYKDPAGNAGATETSTDDASAVNFDRTAPTLSAVHISSSNADNTVAISGDVVSLTFTASEALNANPTVLIGGRAASVSANALNYTATITIQGSDASTDTLSISIAFRDAAGNSGTTVTHTDGSVVAVDNTVPTLSNISIRSNNADSSAFAKATDQIRLTFTVSEVPGADPTVTIMSHAATVTHTGLNYTGTYTAQATDADASPVTFTINCSDAAGNSSATGTATTDASSVIFDKTKPTLTALSIVSDGINSAYAKTGNTVTLSFTANETLGALPDVKIVGIVVPAVQGAGNSYTASYAMQSSDTETASVPFTIDFRDRPGNAGIQVSEADLSGSGVRFDRTRPQMSTVSILSNNANTAYAKAQDIITLNLISNEPLSANPVVTILGNAATVTSNGNNSYSATYQTQLTDANTNPVTFTVNFTDMAGNAGTQVSTVTDASSVNFDKTPPTVSTVHIQSSNATTTLAKNGDIVTVSFVVSETLKANPTVTIAGQAATVTAAYPNYSAAYTMKASDTEGDVTFLITYYDAAGNAGTQASTTNDASSVTFDRSAPGITLLGILSSNTHPEAAKSGDVITVNITADEPLSALPVVSIYGNATVVTDNGGNSYSADYTLQGTDNEISAVPFSLTMTDVTGNTSLPYTESDITDGSSVYFDKTAPLLGTVSISSNNANNSALSKIGDVITLTMTANEALKQSPVVTIGGQSAAVASAGGTTYSATLTTSAALMDAAPLAFSISFTDYAGNAGVAVSMTTDASSVEFDRTAPTLASVHIESDNSDSTKARVGDQVTLSIWADETLEANPTVTIAGNGAAVTDLGGNVYTASYIMQAGDTDAASVAFSISFTDAAGNAAAAARTTTSDGSAVKFDKTLPGLSVVHIESDNANNSALARPGDVVSLTLTSSEPLLSNPTVTIAGTAATVTNNGNNNYTAAYTMQNSDGDAAAITFNVTFRDASGNSGTAVTATTDASSVRFDRTLPQLSPVHIESDNADITLSRSGDRITVTFTASEALLGTPTVFIAGSAAAVTNNGLDYTAVYTLLGSEADTSSAALIINFSDLAGNAGNAVLASSDGSQVLIDNTRPSLTLVHIESTNTDSTRARVGNQILISFHATETLLDLPVVTILGHTVVPVQNTQDYTVSYTLVAGDSDASNPVPFTINFQDETGNSGTQVSATGDGSTVLFDKTPPGLTQSTIYSDNANPAYAKVGDTVTLEFTVNEALLTAPVVGLANRTPALISAHPAYSASYTMLDTDFETDQIAFYITLTDLAGNTVTIDTTLDASNVDFDKSVPTVNFAYSDSLVKNGDSYTIILQPDDDLNTSPGPVITINYAGGSSVTNAAMAYQTYQGTPSWIYTTVCPAGNDGLATVQLTASDFAGNTAVIGTGAQALTVDNTAPTAVAVTSVLPNAVSLNDKYYSSTSDGITVTVPVDNSDPGLIGGRVQLKMKPEGGLNDYNVGAPVTIQNYLAKTFNFTDAQLTTYLLGKPDIQDGQNLLTWYELSDKAGNITTSAIALDTLLLDRVGPTVGTIRDGAAADIDFITNGVTLKANWSGFSDGESGLLDYSVIFGEAADGSDVLASPFVNVGSLTSIDTSQTVAHNIHYYANIYARDKAGNVSDTLISDGVLSDFIAPTSTIDSLRDFIYDTDWSALFLDSLRGNVQDNGSDAASFGLSIQRSSDGYYWHGSGWIVDSTALPIARHLLRENLLEGSPLTSNFYYDYSYYFPASAMADRDTYIFRSSAVDSAGNRQAVTTIDSFQFVVDHPPVFTPDATPASVTEDSVFSRIFTATDADRGTFSDDSLSYHIDYGPRGMVLTELSDTTVRVSWQTDNWDADTVFSIIVSDSRSAQDTVTLPISFIAVNDAPQPFSLLAPRPTTPRAFVAADADTFRFRWNAALDVDDSLLTYRLFLMQQIDDSTWTDSSYAAGHDTSLVLNLQTLDYFDATLPCYARVTVADTQYTVLSADTSRFSLGRPNLQLSTDSNDDSMYVQVIRNENGTLPLVMENTGFMDLDWRIRNLPDFVTLTDTVGTLKRGIKDTLTLLARSTGLPLHYTNDSLLLISNTRDTARDSLTVKVTIYVSSKGELTLAVLQNSAFKHHFEFMLNDSVGMIDSLSFLLDTTAITAESVDDYTYIARTSILSPGSHVIRVNTNSFAGTAQLNRNLVVALAKSSSAWAGRSPDGDFSLSAPLGAIEADQPLLFIDSTAFPPAFPKHAAYQAGQPGQKFLKPVQVSLRPSSPDRALYLVDRDGRCTELPSVERDGKIVAWTDEMGLYKEGPRTIIVADKTELGNAYPNPFNPVTRIPFDLGFLDGPQQVSCKIYNILGQEVLTLASRRFDVGHYELTWAGTNKFGQTVASGVYIARIQTENGYVQTRKMVLIR